MVQWLPFLLHPSGPCCDHRDVVLLPSRCQSFPVSKAPSRDAATFEVTKWNLLEMSLRKLDWLPNVPKSVTNRFHSPTFGVTSPANSTSYKTNLSIGGLFLCLPRSHWSENSQPATAGCVQKFLPMSGVMWGVESQYASRYNMIQSSVRPFNVLGNSRIRPWHQLNLSDGLVSGIQ